MSASLTIAIHDHQGKSLAIGQGLAERGHKIVFRNPDVFLIDHDGPEYYRRLIDTMAAKVTVLYPHGPDAFPAWDGVWEPHPKTQAVFTYGRGQADAMKAYGYPNPVYAIGWPLSPFKPFRSVDPHSQMNVLFAPIHALNNGYLRPEFRTRNILAYSTLLEWHNNEEIKLSVRHVGPLDRSGLFLAFGVTYFPAHPETLHDQVEQADLLVANGNVAFTGLALGTPTVMFGGGVQYADNRRLAAHWPEYAADVAYPYEFFEEGGWLEAYEKPPTDFIERFVGGPLAVADVERVLWDLIADANL